MKCKTLKDIPCKDFPNCNHLEKQMEFERKNDTDKYWKKKLEQREKEIKEIINKIKQEAEKEQIFEEQAKERINTCNLILKEIKGDERL